MKHKFVLLSFLIATLLLLQISSQAQTPYASYPLDGNGDDTTANNQDGVMYGSPTPTTNRFNQAGKALNFNGSTDYIVLPDDFDFPNRTVIMWLNTSQVGSANGYNLFYSSDHPSIQNGMTSFSTYDDGTYGDIFKFSVDQYDYVAKVSTNDWYQVAIVRTPALLKFYINGTVAFKGAAPNGRHSNNSGANTTVIGADRGFLAKFFGKIDDLTIYNSALSDCEISQAYFAGGSCKVIDTVHISVTDTLIIDANLNGLPPNDVNTLKAYPNPAKTRLIIDNGNYASMSGYILKITNSLGQDEFTSPINQQKFDIDINTWSGAGTYVLYIIDPSLNVISTKKIIIQ